MFFFFFSKSVDLNSPPSKFTRVPYFLWYIIWLFASCHETGKNMPEKKEKKF
jgi:hypothetical protein